MKAKVVLSLNPIEDIYLKNSILQFWFKSFKEFNLAVAESCSYSVDIKEQVKAANLILKNITR